MRGRPFFELLKISGDEERKGLIWGSKVVCLEEFAEFKLFWSDDGDGRKNGDDFFGGEAWFLGMDF